MIFLVIAMILKVLLKHFDPFSIYVTHSNKMLTFKEFKTELHNFEGTLKHRDHSHRDGVMKLTSSFSKAVKNESRDRRDVSCFICGGKGDQTKIRPNNYNKWWKPWCNYYKVSPTKENPVAINEGTLWKGSRRTAQEIQQYPRYWWSTKELYHTSF